MVSRVRVLAGAFLLAAPLLAQEKPKSESIISLREIQAELAREKPLTIPTVMARARPMWTVKFASRSSPLPPVYGAVSPTFRPPSQDQITSMWTAPCRGFQYYVDGERWRYPIDQLEAWDVAEVRLIEPFSSGQVGDSLVRTRDCAALHIISLGAWYSLQNPAEALDALRIVGDVTLEQLDAVFATFGFKWRPEAPNLVVYEHPRQQICGDFRRPTDPMWEIMPGAMRDRAILLLNCVKARQLKGNAMFVGETGP